jgi:hypothetical protein
MRDTRSSHRLSTDGTRIPFPCFLCVYRWLNLAFVLSVLSAVSRPIRISMQFLCVPMAPYGVLCISMAFYAFLCHVYAVSMYSESRYLPKQTPFSAGILRKQASRKYFCNHHRIRPTGTNPIGASTSSILHPSSLIPHCPPLIAHCSPLTAPPLALTPSRRQTRLAL